MEESRTGDIHRGVFQAQWSHSEGEPTCTTGTELERLATGALMMPSEDPGA